MRLFILQALLCPRCMLFEGVLGEMGAWRSLLNHQQLRLKIMRYSFFPVFWLLYLPLPKPYLSEGRKFTSWAVSPLPKMDFEK